MLRRSPGMVLCVLAAALATPAPSAQSHTHVDPDGTAVTWYPAECCHDEDCRPVVSIKRALTGMWMTTVDGHTVLVAPTDQRRRSLDMRWHICVAPAEMDDPGPKIMCVFEPPSS